MYHPPPSELRERVLNEVVADFSASPDVVGMFLAGLVFVRPKSRCTSRPPLTDQVRFKIRVLSRGATT